MRLAGTLSRSSASIWVIGFAAASPGTFGIVAREPRTRNTRSPKIRRRPPSLSDLNGSWSDEPAFAHDQVHSARHRARDVHLMQPFDHQALSALDVLHADGERIRLETEFRATPHQ